MFSINDYHPNGFHFDEDGIAWLSADETLAITDPFLAVVIITDTPAITHRYSAWYDYGDIDELECHCNDTVEMEVIKEFQGYPAGSIMNVTLDELFGCAFNGFILPNGYIVETVREAIEHFRLI